MAVTPYIYVSGARDLRRKLNRMIPGSAKELTATLREATQPIATRAKDYATVGSGPTDKHPGAYRDSIRAVAYATRSSVRSLVPYAGVRHFGGSIAPKGTPISIRGDFAVFRAIDDKQAEVTALLARNIEALIRRSVLQ